MPLPDATFDQLLLAYTQCQLNGESIPDLLTCDGFPLVEDANPILTFEWVTNAIAYSGSCFAKEEARLYDLSLAVYFLQGEDFEEIGGLYVKP